MLVDIPAAQHKKIFFITFPSENQCSVRGMRPNIFWVAVKKATSEGGHRFAFSGWYFWRMTVRNLIKIHNKQIDNDVTFLAMFSFTSRFIDENGAAVTGRRSS